MGKMGLVLALAVSLLCDSALTPWLLAANVAGLALLPTRFRVPVLLVAVLAPFPGYPWVYALVLGAYMIEQPRFQEHLLLNLWALAYPLVAQHDTTEWLRVRVLCLLCMYDRFDTKHSGL